MNRVAIKPALLRWTRERAGLDIEDLIDRFPKLGQWESGVEQPTLKQLEAFAKATFAPIGFLFLEVPPEEKMPIPDFRTMGGSQIRRPSPHLLDALYLCQQRQEWYREFARITGLGDLHFVGTARLGDDVVRTAAAIRSELGIDVDERRRLPTWTDALRRFIEQADALGILVMVSGVVGSNNRRRLDPDEFRGFALADRVAPLVFINGADTKAAQMFTLAHELAHIWLGQSAVSDARPVEVPANDVEKWCNRIAAELLVPIAAFRDAYDPSADVPTEMARLARRFKVSTLVVLRRMFDAGGLTRAQLQQAYDAELEHLRTLPKRSGGDFYLTLSVRASKTFARALVSSALEGRTSFTEAFRLLGFKRMDTLRQVGHSLGIIA